MIKIEHAGKIRGGSNWHARASVRFYAHITNEEGAALTEAFRASLEWTNHVTTTCSGDSVSSFEYAFDTRREFALLPLMIRRFSAYGYEVRLVNYDRYHNTSISLANDPATFWREIALAQMFFRE